VLPAEAIPGGAVTQGAAAAVVDGRATATRTVRFEGRSMGSPLRLTVVAETAVAEAAWAEASAEFDASDTALSRFRETSELTRLNRSAGSGAFVRVGRRLERAVVATERARRMTGGRFDPRVLADLERLGDPGVDLGAALDPDVDRARWRATPVVRRDAPGRLAVARPLDLGGIGKGLALRWAARRVRASGPRDFLLDAGGDLVVCGRPPDDDRWRVGIEDPAGGGAPLAVVTPPDGALATSSIRRRHWTAGGRALHHLLDPTTGEPAQGGLQAVTVAGPDPAWAEVWSKTLFIGGRASIATEARARGLAAWWIATDGTVEMTPAARAMTIWVAGEH
jgi:thiamine biosynthesis lipoprotein